MKKDGWTSENRIFCIHRKKQACIHNCTLKEVIEYAAPRFFGPTADVVWRNKLVKAIDTAHPVIVAGNGHQGTRNILLNALIIHHDERLCITAICCTVLCGEDSDCLLVELLNMSNTVISNVLNITAFAVLLKTFGMLQEYREVRTFTSHSINRVSAVIKKFITQSLAGVIVVCTLVVYPWSGSGIISHMTRSLVWPRRLVSSGSVCAINLPILWTVSLLKPSPLPQHLPERSWAREVCHLC